MVKETDLDKRTILEKKNEAVQKNAELT